MEDAILMRYPQEDSRSFHTSNTLNSLSSQRISTLWQYQMLVAQFQRSFDQTYPVLPAPIFLGKFPKYTEK